MKTLADKQKIQIPRLILRALMASLYLLLIFQANVPAGGVGILAAYALAIFICMVVASVLLKDRLILRLNCISWSFLGLLLNGFIGFVCAPL